MTADGRSIQVAFRPFLWALQVSVHNEGDDRGMGAAGNARRV